MEFLLPLQTCLETCVVRNSGWVIARFGFQVVAEGAVELEVPAADGPVVEMAVAAVGIMGVTGHCFHGKDFEFSILFVVYM